MVTQILWYTILNIKESTVWKKKRLHFSIFTAPCPPRSLHGNKSFLIKLSRTSSLPSGHQWNHGTQGKCHQKSFSSSHAALLTISPPWFGQLNRSPTIGRPCMYPVVIMFPQKIVGLVFAPPDFPSRFQMLIPEREQMCWGRDMRGGSVKEMCSLFLWQYKVIV